ncbi:MAG: nitroreductase family deazaflavin-dependent oxidoreductase [Nocardioides sp.]|nr:nitroreductase family deazaflavin-dependent oxidoreductase [Nocardioides sp.]
MALTGTYEPSPNDYVREQVATYEASDGREGGTMRGKPVIILTTVGAKSGNLRKTPLMRVEHDGHYLVVASMGGAPDNPEWYSNIRENPVVELQDGATKKEYDTRELAGEERGPWWERAVAAWPDYASYQEKTDREIPLIELVPRD